MDCYDVSLQEPRVVEFQCPRCGTHFQAAPHEWWVCPGCGRVALRWCASQGYTFADIVV